MSRFCCSCNPQISLQVNSSWKPIVRSPIGIEQRSLLAFKGMNIEFLGQRVADVGSKLGVQWSFIGGSRVVPRLEIAKTTFHKKHTSLSASWVTSSQIASNVFTLGTTAVIPFYTLMVLAPNAKLTKRSMESSIPYIVLGALYAYLLCLSWTPDTLRLMFASKYWLPELPGITKMFSNEMTLASAWLHLLAVDLFAARQVFNDGLENKIETRHSISLCLLFCPIGIVTHVITKELSKRADRSH